MFPKSDKQNSNPPKAASRARPGDVLRSYCAGVLLSIALAMLAAGWIAMQFVDSRAASEVVANAPALVRIAAEMITADPPAEETDLKRIAAELERFPTVRACELDFRVLASSANPDAPARTLRYQTPSPEGRETLRLQAPVNDENGRAIGRVALSFAAPASAAWDSRLWIHLSLAGAGAAAVCVWLYGRAVNRSRALTQVHENLMAYHAGIEPALELLNVHAQGGVVSEAWNSFVEGVATLRRELDRQRCRESLHSAEGAGRAAAMTLERMPIGVLGLDDRNMVIYANAAATALLNLGAAGNTPRPLSERLRDPALADRLIALRDATTDSRELRVTVGDGDTVVRILPLPSDADTGELTVMIQDISQLVQAERSRDDFLAHITHELRTPLTNIRAYTETLSQDFIADEEARRQCYNVIMAETRRLSKLIEDVLSVSQIEAGGARMARTAVRIDELLRETVHETQAAAESKGIELTLKLPSKLPLVHGDRHRLHQVWTNVVGNAIKYTPSGGRVSVEAEASDERISVRVTDTGIGIAPEHHEKIFEKFFRVVDPAVDATEGTGLGLSITREILRMHGGAIRIESTPGKGSTFTVELPAAREPVSGRR